MLTTREAIALKIESTYRTDAAPSASSDAILVADLSVANEGLRMLERNNIKPSISTDKQVFAGTLKKVSFTAEIKGSGAAGTAPEIGQALRACGLSETIVPGTSVAYSPVSLGHESATIYYYQDGRLRKILGCRGTVTFNLTAGEYGTAQFEFTGHDGSFADQAFPTLSYDSTVPVPLINLGFTVDSFNAIINNLTLNLGNNLLTPGDIRDTYGFGEIRISRRDPNGTLDPEAALIATKDFETIFKNGTEMALTTGVIGSAAGNRFQLDANIALRDISQGEREEVRTDELTYGCHEQTTDDEFTILFT